MISVHDKDDGLVHGFELSLELTQAADRIFYRAEVVIHDVVAVIRYVPFPYRIAPIETVCAVWAVPLIADIKGEYRIAGGDILGKQTEHLGKENVVIGYGGAVFVIISLGIEVILKAKIAVDVKAVVEASVAWMAAVYRIALLSEIPHI